jgi:thiamine kinase-like enzyme
MEEGPVIIDWESAGYVNPIFDLLETAIYWSVKEEGTLDKDRFFSFLNGYRKVNEQLEADWKTALLGGFSGKLGWLEYNLKRSLGLECTDKAEQQLGTEEVVSTIELLKQYAKQIIEIEMWLK